MEKSNNKGGFVAGVLVGIIIMLGVGIGLFATNTISFSKKCDVNTSKEDSDSSTDTSMVDITLPSGNVITTNIEYKKLLNGIEKMIVVFPESEDNIDNEESYLEDYIKKEMTNYPDGFEECKRTEISKDSFDFDNDGINEIIISFCEEYLLLHYYNGKVYGYSLGGYRTNGSWRIDGSSYYSGSAVDNGFLKYTFNNEKIVSTNIVSRERDSKNSTLEETKVIYKINEKEVTKEEYEKKYNEQLEIKLIDFVNYSN